MLSPLLSFIEPGPKSESPISGTSVEAEWCTSTSTFSDQDFAFERAKVNLNSSRELPVYSPWKKLQSYWKLSRDLSTLG